MKVDRNLMIDLTFAALTGIGYYFLFKLVGDWKEKVRAGGSKELPGGEG
jgi:hypothetical protein